MASRKRSFEQSFDLVLQSASERETEPDALSDTDSSSEGEVDSRSDFSVEDSSSSDEEVTHEAHHAGGERPTHSQPARLSGHGGHAHGARQVPFAQYAADVYNWVAPAMVQPVIPPFSGEPGCKANTDGFLPVDFFNLFVDDEFFYGMVQQTNLYAAQFLRKHDGNLRPRSRALQWSPTSVAEMKTFWGLSLLMGIVRKPSIALYWCTDPSLATPFFPAVMSRNRYLVLQRMLHFSDNSAALPRNDPNYDKLFKIRPFLEHFTRRFSGVYVPGQHISIEESLVLYQGRLLFKQYVPSKRAQHGIKVYVLCESNTGYAYSMRVYAGKYCNINPPGSPAYLGVREKIVWDLCSSLFNKGHHLYVDKFYTGIPLFKELHSLGTLACGTIHSNQKGFPKQLVCKKLDKGACAALRCEEVLAVKYCDRRDVHMLSTIHDESTAIVAARGHAEQVSKPKCILDYNRYMVGVDRTDQLLEPYHPACKSRRWYKKLAIHIMHVATCNAYVVYRTAAPEHKMSFLQFENAVANALVQVHVEAAPIGALETVARLNERHFGEYNPPTPNQTQPYRRCKVCTKQGKRRDTRFYCPQCPSKPALCQCPCFALYHTKEKYWEIE
ncbi:piggyBac transposable element-derived protein 4-like [Ambystoma mexicanum]|uniref:piggyBac transposable element-derived protein 4-like n=1 Tax=Ambystoma mexicanum TaxID=8296 RepID=UPI0037E84216